jgi:alkane 1-monooxygenase
MRNPLSYFAAVAVAACLILGGFAGGVGFYVMPISGFLILPFADHIKGVSRWPTESALTAITPARERAYSAAPVAAFAATFIVLGWGLWASTWPLQTWERVGLILSVGMFTGFIGIVTAHELMHRASALHRAMAWMLMSAALYPHFCVEHIMRHHVHMATPEDHATARRGQSLYAFLPGTVLLGLLSAIRFKPAKVLGTYAVLLALLVAIHRWLGADALILALLQALFAILLLEGINYLEHYGLLRARRPDGRYEAPGPGHSWDTSNYLTNTNIFNLGRHTDHHSNARRPYYRLRHIDAAPQLPFGYAAMFMIALVPPLWFRIMDRRLDEWHSSSGRGRAAAYEA